MKEVKEFLKLAADSMKNETLNQLLESDVEYQKKAGEEKQALEAVGGLKLTEEEKEAVDILIRNFLNLGIIESRNYIRISYGSFLYAGTNGISPFS